MENVFCRNNLSLHPPLLTPCPTFPSFAHFLYHLFLELWLGRKHGEASSLRHRFLGLPSRVCSRQIFASAFLPTSPGACPAAGVSEDHCSATLRHVPWNHGQSPEGMKGRDCLKTINMVLVSFSFKCLIKHRNET